MEIWSPMINYGNPSLCGFVALGIPSAPYFVVKLFVCLRNSNKCTYRCMIITLKGNIQGRINWFWCGINMLFTRQINRVISAHSWDTQNHYKRDPVSIHTYIVIRVIGQTWRTHYFIILNYYFQSNIARHMECVLWVHIWTNFNRLLIVLC